MCFFTDIDHIVSVEAVQAACNFSGARLMFPRTLATLDEAGKIVNLSESQVQDHMPVNQSVHQNIFAMRRELFLDEMHGGYDESLCAGGKYGGDDIEFNQRYAALVASGRAEPDVLGPRLFVYPDPASNRHFHNLSRANSPP